MTDTFQLFLGTPQTTRVCKQCGDSYPAPQGSTSRLCPDCRHDNILGSKRDWWTRNMTMPERKELTDNEIAAGLGRLIHGIVNQAADDIARGTRTEHNEALFWLENGGLEEWYEFVGIEVDANSRRMIEAAKRGVQLYR